MITLAVAACHVGLQFILQFLYFLLHFLYSLADSAHNTLAVVYNLLSISNNSRNVVKLKIWSIFNFSKSSSHKSHFKNSLDLPTKSAEGNFPDSAENLSESAENFPRIAEGAQNYLKSAKNAEKFPRNAENSLISVENLPEGAENSLASAESAEKSHESAENLRKKSENAEKSPKNAKYIPQIAEKSPESVESSPKTTISPENLPSPREKLSGNLLTFITGKISKFFNNFSSNKPLGPSCSVSSAGLEALRKVPSHVGVISGSPADYGSLCSMLASLSSYGVRIISLYDLNGDFGSRREQIREEVERIRFGEFYSQEELKTEVTDILAETPLDVSPKNPHFGLRYRGAAPDSESLHPTVPPHLAASPAKAYKPQESLPKLGNGSGIRDSPGDLILNFFDLRHGREDIARVAEVLANRYTARKLPTPKTKLTANLDSEKVDSEILTARENCISLASKNTDSSLKSGTLSLDKEEESLLDLYTSLHTRKNHSCSLERAKSSLPSLKKSRHCLEQTTNLPTQAEISSLLSTAGSCDPELIITIGQAYSTQLNSTVGFAPWSLRASEIHFLRLSEGQEGLDRVMGRYSNCEQRWGK